MIDFIKRVLFVRRAGMPLLQSFVIAAEFTYHLIKARRIIREHRL